MYIYKFTYSPISNLSWLQTTWFGWSDSCQFLDISVHGAKYSTLTFSCKRNREFSECREKVSVSKYTTYHSSELTCGHNSHLLISIWKNLLLIFFPLNPCPCDSASKLQIIDLTINISYEILTPVLAHSAMFIINYWWSKVITKNNTN